MFTKQGIENIKKVKNEYSNLYQFYDEYLGNFQMSKNDVLENLDSILKWLENNSDYFLICENHEEYEGNIYFLTNIE